MAPPMNCRRVGRLLEIVLSFAISMLLENPGDRVRVSRLDRNQCTSGMSIYLTALNVL
jgi:hypothetical protein